MANSQKRVYTQSHDPGDVGEGRLWVDTSTDPPTVKVRNSDNDGWVDLAFD